MNTIHIDTQRLEHYFSAQDILNTQASAQDAKKKLISGNGEGNDFLGWIDLPICANVAELENIRKDVARLANKIDVLVVVGIGGSYLGARAVIESLQSEFSGCCKGQYPFIVYAGHTLSEDYYCQLMQFLDSKSYAVVVISKSGTTTEPAIAFRILKNHLEQRYGSAEAKERIIAITDANKGALHDIAKAEGYGMYRIPDNVGGRFSVLTPVGLLPIAMAGFDIDKLLQGAKEMREVCLKGDTCEDNPAMQYAVIRNLLYHQGRKVEMLVNYLPNLKYLSEWWKQLFGESEGKQGKGILPHSLSFTTDLHSMGQYVQEGERLMFETVISIEQPNAHISIPHDNDNLDGINYLVEKSLTEINHKAEEGTALAHQSGNVPVMRMVIPCIDEYHIGQLIYLFEFACGISGYMLGVNPFDQPGVEAYKRNMFMLLDKPGYQSK